MEKRERVVIHTVDGRNPAPVDIFIQYPITYIIVSYIPGGAGFQPSTVSWQSSWWLNQPI